MNRIRKTFAAAAVTALFASSAAHADVIGVYGYWPALNNIQGISQHGHSLVALDSLSADALAKVDTVILSRDYTGNIFLESFVNAGGTLITEWNSANYGMSLLGGTVAGGGYQPSDVVFTDAGRDAGLGYKLGAGYNDGDATQYYQNITGIGSGTVYATRDDGAAAIVGGAFGAGFVWVNGYDWGDYPSGATFQLIANELAYDDAGAVPEPGSLALLGLGLLGIASRYGRRRA